MTEDKSLRRLKKNIYGLNRLICFYKNNTASVFKLASNDKCQKANLLEISYFAHCRGLLAVATEASSIEHCQEQDQELGELLT